MSSLTRAVNSIPLPCFLQRTFPTGTTSFPPYPVPLLLLVNDEDREKGETVAVVEVPQGLGERGL